MRERLQRRIPLAPVSPPVASSAHQTSVLPVLPGWQEVSSVATVPASSVEKPVAAVHQLLGRDHGLGALVDANTVRDGARSAHSPARSAVGLVPNSGDGLAVRPLLTGIERLGGF